MIVDVKDTEKMVTIWLTHQDQADARIKETIKRISEEYRSKKYLVGVFLSGEEDLLEQTSGLLCHNQQAVNEMSL